jgi:hypothetical protein
VTSQHQLVAVVRVTAMPVFCWPAKYVAPAICLPVCSICRQLYAHALQHTLVRSWHGGNSWFGCWSLYVLVCIDGCTWELAPAWHHRTQVVLQPAGEVYQSVYGVVPCRQCPSCWVLPLRVSCAGCCLCLWAILHCAKGCDTCVVIPAMLVEGGSLQLLSHHIYKVLAYYLSSTDLHGYFCGVVARHTHKR